MKKKEKDGTMRKRTLSGFLIDGAIITGSSGSPVVPKPLTMRYVRDRIQIATSPMMVLGIRAESRYAPLSTPSYDYLSFAGLELAFDADICGKY
jgi:hypothetical protein